MDPYEQQEAARKAVFSKCGRWLRESDFGAADRDGEDAEVAAGQPGEGGGADDGDEDDISTFSFGPDANGGAGGDAALGSRMVYG